MIFLGFFFFAGIKDPQIPSLPGTRRGSSAASFPFKSLGREKALPVRPSLNRCFHARESESRGKIQWMFPDQSHPFFSRSLSFVSSWSASSPLGRLMWLLKGSFRKAVPKNHTSRSDSSLRSWIYREFGARICGCVGQRCRTGLCWATKRVFP